VIVVDASVVIELLLRTDKGLQLAERIFPPGESLHAPHLMDLEVTQVLRRYVSRREVSAERAWQAMDLLSALPVRRYAHEPLLARVWSLRQNLTAYDAAYVALAEGLGATLITLDRSLAGVPGVVTTVELA
jgi:predicted nucleic acid-binding protein